MVKQVLLSLMASVKSGCEIVKNEKEEEEVAEEGRGGRSSFPSHHQS